MWIASYAIAKLTLVLKSEIENLGLCSTVRTGIVLNLYLVFEQKRASCSYKIVLVQKNVMVPVQNN